MLHGEFLYNYDKIRVSSNIHSYGKSDRFEIGDFYSLTYISGSDISMDGKRYHVPDKSVILFEKLLVPRIDVLEAGAKVNMLTIDFKKAFMEAEKMAMTILHGFWKLSWEV